MAKTTIALSDEMNGEVESKLSYGDSKSAWVRQAIRYRIAIDPILNEIGIDESEDRLEFVKQAVREKAEKRRQKA